MRRAVDTNVLVRLITQDDPEQFRRAALLLDCGQVMVLTTVLLETEWVLRSAFRYPRERVYQSFEALFLLPNVVAEEKDLVDTGMALHRAGMDFADALHLAGARGCEIFVSFDEAFVKRAQQSAVDLPAAIQLL